MGHWVTQDVVGLLLSREDGTPLSNISAPCAMWPMSSREVGKGAHYVRELVLQRKWDAEDSYEDQHGVHDFSRGRLGRKQALG